MSTGEKYKSVKRRARDGGVDWPVETTAVDNQALGEDEQGLKDCENDGIYQRLHRSRNAMEMWRTLL
jgi:hypothetical protein